MIWTFEAPNYWLIFLARFLNIDVQEEDPAEDGVVLKWRGMAPSVDVLFSAAQMAEVSDRTLVRGIPESSEATVFLCSPAPLCQNMKNMKKAGLPQAYPQWLVVAIPWKQEGHVAASLGHVDLTQLLDSGFSSSSSSSPSSSSSSSSSSSTLPTHSHSYNTRHKKGKEGKQEKEEKEEEKVVEGSSGESDSSSSSDDE